MTRPPENFKVVLASVSFSNYIKFINKTGKGEMRRFYILIISLFVIQTGSICGLVSAATFNVSTTPELRQALVDAAQNGQEDTIILADGTYATTDDGGGTFTFLAGHDPEDYRHMVHDPPTDLNLHKNSPGYRLILNNVLFPAAKKKERKT